MFIFDNEGFDIWSIPPVPISVPFDKLILFCPICCNWITEPEGIIDVPDNVVLVNIKPDGKVSLELIWLDELVTTIWFAVVPEIVVVPDNVVLVNVKPDGKVSLELIWLDELVITIWLAVVPDIVVSPCNETKPVPVVKDPGPDCIKFPPPGPPHI